MEHRFAIYQRRKEEGRKTPVHNGYRGQFYYDNQNWDASQQFIDKVICFPGDTVNVLMQTANPLNHAGKLFVGKLFEVREGRTTVGIGKITQLFNNSFSKAELDKYERHIKRLLLTTRAIQINTVQLLQSIRSTLFNAKEYQTVKQLLEQKRWWQVKELDKGTADFHEYLIIVAFEMNNIRNTWQLCMIMKSFGRIRN